ncbi:dehydrodolichyl diphosphate synthase 6-like [Euphorbia lathyris]|uniref:dehydrodolichyl diphosphate synthase 6-like n=1 Tax=Euphorbia lathyris TaxID=212925 RepID=UPI00331342B7
MGMHSSSGLGNLYQSLCRFIRICMFCVLSMGPIPNHVAFIMDGNRRYAKKKKSKEGAGHRAGFSSLISILKYCYELGVKYVTVYAFSIDNFKRSPDEVTEVMDLMLEKTEELLQKESIVHQYGIRVRFIGNLKLVSEALKIAAEKVMKATANNTKCTLLICIAYTSRDEIVHAVQGSCINKWKEIRTLKFSKTNNICAEEVKEENKKNDVDKRDGSAKCLTCFEDSKMMQEKYSIIKLIDIEKHMYMSVAPEPEILIRSSGETRLSNFLLWQSTNCLLYSPNALWPEIGLWHFILAVLNFQHNHSYLEKESNHF